MKQLTAELSSAYDQKPDDSASTGRPIVRPELAFAGLLICSVAVWLFAIRAPFWLDETVSYWQIAGGFRQIWSRQEVMFPAYSYILWMTKLLFGASETALRIPSLLAMLGAVYTLYLIAREFFSVTVSLIVAIVFSLHPSIIFAAIDARPYAFALLALNCAILFLVRWMHSHRQRDAIACGITSALIFYFHYLFSVILPAFALLLLLTERRRLMLYKTHIVKALLVFTLVLMPVVPQFLRVFQTRHSHVFSTAPNLVGLVETFAPGAMLLFFLLAALFAAAFRQIDNSEYESPFTGIASLLLAVIPLAILYLVSSLTNTHVFVDRYCLVAAPGIALCWGLLLSRIRSRSCQFVFCFVLLAWAAQVQFVAPVHGHSWKPALDVANKATSIDHAPVLICSDLVEADHGPIPTDIYSTWLYAPLSYYHVQSQVVPLPRSLNAAAEAQVRNFLATATPAHRRFLLMGYYSGSSTILSWVDATTKSSYISNPLGTYDGVSVIEYTPR